MTYQHDHPTPLIREGFARRAIATALPAALAVTVLFGVLSRQLLDRQARHNAWEQACLCMSMLEPDSQAGLSASVARIQERYDRLLAVATLSARNSVDRIWPDSSATRAIAAAALYQPSEPVCPVQLPSDGGLTRVWAVRMRLGNLTSNQSVQAIFLIEQAPIAANWWTTACLFGLLTGGICYFATRLLTQWLESQVVAPLRELTIRSTDFSRAWRGNDETLTRWSELASLAKHLHHLRRLRRELQLRIRRHERIAQVELQAKEEGYRRQLRRAEDKAMRDPLTVLHNRRFLDEELERIAQQHLRTGQELCLVMLDLDNFKQHNDTYGHKAGDTLLEFVGAMFRATIREDDIAVRYGGDEFVLLIRNVDREKAQRLVERIIKLMGRYAISHPEGQRVGLSAGISCLIRDGCQSSQDLLRRADTALYHAKRKGKGKAMTALCK